MFKQPKYSEFIDEGAFLSAGMKIHTDFPFLKEYIRKAVPADFPETRSFGGIYTVKSVPDRIAELVADSFGVLFSEQEDAYCVVIGEDVKVYSRGERGLIYGVLDVLRYAEGQFLPRGVFYESPVIGRRGLKVYLPGREGIPFFKELVDFLCRFRMNTLMIEIGGAMEYKRHPEINEGWLEYTADMLSESGRSYVVQQTMYPWKKNAIHADNGYGGFLTQEETKEIVDYCRERFIEVIPEVPCHSHCDYMLTRHPELRERQNDDYADTYCPSNEGSYELLFDILDEVIEVFSPKSINIGHDEFYTFGKCGKCKGKDPVDLYADDILRIHKYLTERGVTVEMWAEQFLDARWNGMPCGGAHIIKDYDGKEYIEEIPAVYPAIEKMPADIEMFHWYHFIEGYEDEYLSRGFTMTYGNFDPKTFKNWRKRMERGVKGCITSNWSGVEEDNLQRNGHLYDVAFADRLYWENDFSEDLREGYRTDALEALYSYKYRNVEHGIRIIHSTDHDMKYKPFYDGNYIVHDEFDLGCYKLTYTNGKTAKLNVEYGRNISTRRDTWETEDPDEALKIAEVSSSTLPIRIKGCGGYEMAYETVFENPFPKLMLCKIEFVPNKKIGANINVNLLKVEIF